MKTAATKGWTVVAANGEHATFASKRVAERVAKNLRTGKIAGRIFAGPMAAVVVPAVEPGQFAGAAVAL